MNLPQAARISRLADARLCLASLVDAYRTATPNSHAKEELQLGIDELRDEIKALERQAAEAAALGAVDAAGPPRRWAVEFAAR